MTTTRVRVTSKPGAKVPAIIQVGAEEYKVAVRERAVNDQANIAICKAMAYYFGVAPSCVRIARGKSSRKKILEVQL
jgi:uncharacterized protein YggU (UPF0235/DUF167 family)